MSERDRTSIAQGFAARDREFAGFPVGPIETPAPVRIQRKRTKGWKMPPNTVSVTRPGPFGNPFVAGEITNVWHESGGWPFDMYRDCFQVIDVHHAVTLYRMAMKRDPRWYHDTWKAPADLSTLRGKNLACFCPLDQPCHADVLLELANQLPENNAQPVSVHGQQAGDGQ